MSKYVCNFLAISTYFLRAVKKSFELLQILKKLFNKYYYHTIKHLKILNSNCFASYIVARTSSISLDLLSLNSKPKVVFSLCDMTLIKKLYKVLEFLNR